MPLAGPGVNPPFTGLFGDRAHREAVACNPRTAWRRLQGLQLFGVRGQDLADEEDRTEEAEAMSHKIRRLSGCDRGVW